MVERALGSPAERRAEGWRDRVVVVPGGHRPSQPDQLQRDRARARLAVSGSRRIVVLGCTVGAGQTVITLRTGEQLASLRDEPVAVLDLNPGPSSLLRMARQDPALAGEARARAAAQGQPSRLEVIATEVPESGSDQAQDEPEAADSARVFELMSARYSLTLADPGASAVPRVLPVADQLILVAPASAEAAGAIAMTLEWLDAHGHSGLAASAITVLNGISKQTMSFVEQAEAVAGGRCRAIVRVPWDDQLASQTAQRQLGAHQAGHGTRPGGQLSGSAERAYTALAGALVAGLVTAPQLRRGRS
jgi:MinD-like ATPase involved in chromosome partitioning or flagellar assembly